MTAWINALRGATEALINSYSADDAPIETRPGNTANSPATPSPFSGEGGSGGVYNPPELLDMLKLSENKNCADCGTPGIQIFIYLFLVFIYSFFPTLNKIPNGRLSHWECLYVSPALVSIVL